MVIPQPAVVRPRIVSPLSGEILPLDEVVAEELAGGCRIIQISGGPGSGKSTALAHLAATLPPARDLVFLDDAATSEVASHASRLRVICANRVRYPEIVPVILPLPLAPWTDDELIEYLLAAQPQECGSVMRRWAASPDKAELSGNPALSRAVADLFAADPALASIRVAIQRIVLACLREPPERRIAAEFCLAILLRDSDGAALLLAEIAQHDEDYQRLRPLRHALVQRLLAGEHLAELILSGRKCPALARALPRPLIEELAQLAVRDSLLAERLRDIYAGNWRPYHAQAASILFAADRTWRPASHRPASLSRGSFAGAAWARIELPCTNAGVSDLSEADLSSADLTGAVLDGLLARGVSLAGAHLDKASLVGMIAEDANLTGARLVATIADRIILRSANLQGAMLDDASLIGAELDGADLAGASFRKANLAYAVLLGAKVEGTDFTGADLHDCCLRDLVLREAVLDGASFHGADLSRCDLEGVQLEAADFFHANLEGALLTGTVLPQADFRRADLRGTGLADIQWEDADLRGADLRGCTFHMGSTRSGLVGSPYPGHGSKTGFYTDDYHDQSFKHPAEIRKANLCGADLRGARIDDVDFYLVDLRGALFDPAAGEHLERCGAILHEHGAQS